MLITKSNIDRLAKDILSLHLTVKGFNENIVNRLSSDGLTFMIRTVKDGVIKHTLYIGNRSVLEIDLADFKVNDNPSIARLDPPSYTHSLVSKKIEDACLVLVGYEINLGVEHVISKMRVSTNSDMYFDDIHINIDNVEINDIRKEKFLTIVRGTQLWYSAPFRWRDEPELKDTLTSIFKRKVLDGSFVLHL